MNRLWADANVLLRFVTGDPEPLAERARRLMARVDRGEIVLTIPHLVIAEVVWVLRSFYRYPLADIAAVVAALVSAPGVEIEEPELVLRALELARDAQVDFVDAYLAVRASRQGEQVVTFDAHDFRRLPVAWIVPD